MHSDTANVIPLGMPLQMRVSRRLDICTPLFNYAKYAVMHCWLCRSLVLEKSHRLCGTKTPFSHKPPKPRSMKMLFTSSHGLRRNGLTMFSRARLRPTSYLGNFLPSFVLPTAAMAEKERKNLEHLDRETFDSTIIADSNCFKEHRAST